MKTQSFHDNSVLMKTVRQQMIATGKRPRPSQAAAMPSRRAAKPAHGVPAESTMAGKVITASVTYGT